MLIVPVERAEAVAVTADAVRAGELVVVPTDTLYGLVADPRQPGATARVFAAKGRPESVELPVFVTSIEQAEELAELGSTGRRLASAFWPGLLTIVVQRRALCANWSLGGDGASIGLRWPDHRFVCALGEAVGPLAVTSANAHRQPTPETAHEAAGQLTEPPAVVVDGGVCAGLPSTVVRIASDGGVEILRAGRLSSDEVLRQAVPDTTHRGSSGDSRRRPSTPE